MTNNKFTRWAFLGLILVNLWLFRPTFSKYFFQDDWFSLLISRAGSIRDWLTFFVPRPDLIYYRPLGMQMPFWLLTSLFGLIPLPFKIATWLMHIVNSWLAGRIIYQVIKDRKLALFAGALYLTSTVYLTIYYLLHFCICH